MLTNSWRLLDLGGLDPLRAQTFYEAVAAAVGGNHVPNTLILCYPKEPYVCIGFHQELDKEVNIEFCRRNNLTVIRRSQGGGAVYLDSGQQFYQVVARRNDPIIPPFVDKFFEKFLQPTVYAYRRLGVHAEYKPINDVVANNRKISGNGAGELDNSAILVGNIIFDIDYDRMSSVLKVPNEKFRDKLAKSMKEWVTSLKKELGYVPERSKITELLVEGYGEIGIKLVLGKLTDKEEAIFNSEVKPKHLSKEWLYLPQFRRPRLTEKRVVRVSDNVVVVEANYKAGKMIRVTAEIAYGIIRDILISGDFFMVPETALPKLEEALRDKPIEQSVLLKAVRDFYEINKIHTPGVKPEDFVEAIMKAAPESQP